jgi:hypothetical protein
MAIVIGVWVALAGGISVLAGASAARRARRLRQYGQTAWALVLTRPSGPDEDFEPRGMLIQYALPDGRVIERALPASARKARRLAAGHKVLVWYDPADPGEVLVFGREGLITDRVFVAIGSLLLLSGVLIAAVGG